MLANDSFLNAAVIKYGTEQGGLTIMTWRARWAWPVRRLQPISAAASAAVGDQLLFNRGFEAAVDATTRPRPGGRPGSRSTPDARPPTCRRSLVARRPHRHPFGAVGHDGYSDGDSKWVPDLVSVQPQHVLHVLGLVQVRPVDCGQRLLRDQTRTLTGLPKGTGRICSPAFPAASDWTQYKTGFTMPAGRVRGAVRAPHRRRRLAADRRLLADRDSGVRPASTGR